LIFRRRLAVLALLIFLLPAGLEADVTNGFVRLILHGRTGRFSLLYLSDTETMLYEPLFNSSDPRASFLSVFVDGKVYRLGDSKIFTAGIERRNGDPALVFESPFLKVSEVFSLVKTPNSPIANGVMITVTVQNSGDKEALVGLRVLIDTQLGEGWGRVPFLTNKRIVAKETLIEGTSGERFWISRGENVSLMGSIINPLDLDGVLPNYVHIANWKRLNDVPWRLRHFEDRSFTNMPYSVMDSAVCYYYEPSPLSSDGTFVYKILLSTEDIEWYNSVELPFMLEEIPEEVPDAKKEVTLEIKEVVEAVEEVIEAAAIEEIKEIPASAIDIFAIEEEAAAEAAENDEDPDMLFLLKLQNLMDQFNAGEIEIDEPDLTEIEKAIERLKS